MTPARTAAYRVLRAVFGGDDLPAALARVRNTLGDERDRALVTEVTTGTIRWLGALDWVIEQVAARPTERLDGEVLTVLRLGAYQLLYLDRVPAAAAVYESVNLVRRVGKASAAGFVNAVLRGIASTVRTPPLPPEPGSSATREARLAYLSVTCSHPRWLVERWLDRRGFLRTMEWVRFNNRPPALTLRANLLRTTTAALARQLAEHDVRTEPTRFARAGLRVLAGNPLRTPLFGQGLFLVQDEASQLVAELTAARPGEHVLDACAAPGGKTTVIAAAMRPTGPGATRDSCHGLLVASDLRPARLGLLRRTLDQTGAMGVRVVRLDLRQPPPFQPVFDCVLVDAPCSGLGVVRRDPRDTLAAPAGRPGTVCQRPTHDGQPGFARRPARRPTGVRHLFQRAGGERGGGRRLSRRPSRLRASPPEPGACAAVTRNARHHRRAWAVVDRSGRPWARSVLRRDPAATRDVHHGLLAKLLSFARRDLPDDL